MLCIARSIDHIDFIFISDSVLFFFFSVFWSEWQLYIITNLRDLNKIKIGDFGFDLVELSYVEFSWLFQFHEIWVLLSFLEFSVWRTLLEWRFEGWTCGWRGCPPQAPLMMTSLVGIECRLGKCSPLLRFGLGRGSGTWPVWQGHAPLEWDDVEERPSCCRDNHLD